MNRHSFSAIVIVFCLVVFMSLGMAPVLGSRSSADESPHFAGVINLTQGMTADIQVAGLERFLVGAPNIVSAERSDSKLRLTGKLPGSTVVSVWGAKGLNSYKVRVTAGSEDNEVEIGRVPAVSRIEVELADLAPVEMKLLSGGSDVLKGRNITRTAVSDPEIVNIIPVSANEVLLNAIKEGTATVRIWDSRGLTTCRVTVVPRGPSPDERAAEITKQIGIPGITARVIGDTVILSGTTVTSDIAQKAGSVAEASGLKVINLITVEAVTPAMVVESLKAALPNEPLSYQILTDQTVMIRGSVPSAEEAKRIQDVVQAWISTSEPGISDKATATNQVSFLGGQQEIQAEAIDKNRVLAQEPKKGEVIVSDEYNFYRQVFGGRIPNGPRVVAILEINPALAKQLLISALVIEVDKNKIKQLGIQWGSIIDSVFTAQPFLITDIRPTPAELNEAGPFMRANPLAANLKALINDNAARILSEPKILIADGHSATIIVGGELPIPIAQSSTIGGGNITVEFKPFGIQLTVRPKISQDGRILMTLTPEVSSVDTDPTKAVITGGIRIPALKTSRATTTVHIGNGETLAIGGLISSEDIKVVDKIPLLGDIPIIGELFKSSKFTKNKTELVILVTPQIVDRNTQVPIEVP